jgi:Mg2+-importing ATPase
MCTQVLALHLLRTEKIPFLESRASLALCLLTLADVVVASIFCLTPVGATLDLAVLPLAALPPIFALIVGYGLTLMVLKRLYIKRYGKLL